MKTGERTQRIGDWNEPWFYSREEATLYRKTPKRLWFEVARKLARRNLSVLAVTIEQCKVQATQRQRRPVEP